MRTDELQPDAALLDRRFPENLTGQPARPLGCFTLTGDGVIRHVRPSGAAFLGVPRDALLGVPFQQFLSDASRLSFASFLRAAVTGRTGAVCEVLLAGADEGLRRVQLVADSDEDDAGPERLCHVVATDITAQRRVEEALTQRERYLQGLSEAVHLLLEHDAEVPYQEFTELVGRASCASRVYVFLNHRDERGEWLMNQVAEWCSSGVRPEIANPLLQNLPYSEHCPRWLDVLSRGGTISGPVAGFPEIERRDLEPQGILSLLVLPLLSETDFLGFIGFDNCTSTRAWEPTEQAFLLVAANALAHTITHRRAEESLRRSEGTYRLLADNATDVIWTMDARWRFTYVSPSVQQLRGYTAEEAMSQTLDQMLTPESLKLVRRLMAEGRREPIRLELEQTCRDGTTAWAEIAVRPLFGPQGEFAGVLGHSRDITQRRCMEAERAQMEAVLRQQQKLDSIGTLASGVAHEINNPINGVMNYAQLILDQSPPDDTRTEFAREIIHETERVARIVRNLLQFARDDKGDPPTPTHLRTIIEAALSLIQTVIRHDQIKLQVDIPDGLPECTCQAQQIEQVVMNLLTNARDALNEKYRQYDPDKLVSVTCSTFEQDGRPWVRTTIEDHGPGIKPQVRDRIFDPFFTTKNRERRGTGLGLSISHGIVKDHGGELHLETEPGHWTRFHLDLPADTADSPEPIGSD